MDAAGIDADGLKPIPEFQRAFGCKVGQPMVRTPACKVW
jgi:hypothetical protein